jgi:UDPglucose 6-dehydrogenase
MKIGFIGLGKLGLPCALGFEIDGGYELHGYDPDPNIKTYLELKNVPYREALIDSRLAKSKLTLHNSAKDLVESCDVVFISVQTPHEELYEGATKVPESRKDFDYTHLQTAVSQVSEGLRNPNHNPLIVVISTVLPGTMRRLILPILEQTRQDFRFCYNPYFIAMGTTLPDFLDPEFILIGSDRKSDAEFLSSIYKNVHSAQSRIMQIESAELTKVAYNTFIGFKIVFANTLSEICQARGGNVDEITQALSTASMRLMSGKYLKAGMGDGGGCHPRDQIAMSWLAQDAELSTDIFGYLANARDSQTFLQAQQLVMQSKSNSLPVCILGWSYKPETNLTVGSPARLLGSILDEMNISYKVYDPYVFPDRKLPDHPCVYFVATPHEDFSTLKFRSADVVLDPWGIDNNWGEARIIRPGRGRPLL